MRRDASMLAALFERSMGLDEAWEVSRTWFEEVEGGRGEPRVRVARRRGHAIPCPECGVACGVHDTRERAWRHLDIWQSGTYVHCAVPRTDCPEHGVRTVLMPWEVRPNSHLAALLEDRVLAACMRGSTVKAEDGAPVVGDHRPRDMPVRAVAQAREPADHPGAGRVGIDEASRPGATPTCRPCPTRVAGVRTAARGGSDRAPRLACATGPEALRRDRAATGEAARDMSGPIFSGVFEEMPRATQTAGRPGSGECARRPSAPSTCGPSARRT